MRWIIMLLALICLPACGSKSDLATNDPPPSQLNPASGNTPEPLYCEEISNAAKFNFDPSELKETFVVDYKIREACICVVYQYSGCEKVKAYLSWDGHWPSEFHPVIDMELRVRSPGMCDMVLTDSTCFSIKKLSFGGDQVGVTINEATNRLDIDFTKY